MTNANDARKAHRLLDYVSQGRAILDEECEFLRSFLPGLPKQKTLEEITEHVCDAWTRANYNEWAGNIDNPNILLEEWLVELYMQLKGLKDVPANTTVHPEFLETEADYENAPAGTVAAKDGWLAWVKQKNGDWSCDGGSEEGSTLVQTGKRRVLRWGWTNE